MQNQTGTRFERLTNYVREATALVCTGHGVRSLYAGDVLEGRFGFDTALDQAREVLEMRKQEIAALERNLNKLEEVIANGGKQDYIQAIDELYAK
jgi:predicted patatin/cPLA2 family phospholipase